MSALDPTRDDQMDPLVSADTAGSTESLHQEVEVERGAKVVESRKSLTLFNGVTMSIGCIIGSGIFISPAGVQKHAGSVGLSLLVWLFSGIFTAIGAYCYAELGTLIRKSGGEYTYILEAFGPFLGFMRLWIEAFIVRPCTVTIVSLTFALYLMRPFFPDCNPPDDIQIIIAAGLILFVTAINCMSVRAATLVQDVLTVAKIIALTFIICTGLFLLCTGKSVYYDSFENIFGGTASDFSEVSLAFYSGLFAYSGWNYLNYIVDELENPKRNLPLAIAISISTCTIIQLLVLVAFYTVLSPDEMLDSAAVAVTFANKIFGPVAFLMSLCVALSTFGSANGVVYTSSRLFYAGAKEGQMPKVLTMINRETNTPIPAVILTGILSLLYLLGSSDVFALINYIQISYWIAIAGATAALFYFRRTMPDASRPIKVHLFWPSLFLFGCILLIVVPCIASPYDALIGFLIMLTAIPVYIIFITWRKPLQCIIKRFDCISSGSQKLFLVVDEDNNL